MRYFLVEVVALPFLDEAAFDGFFTSFLRALFPLAIVVDPLR